MRVLACVVLLLAAPLALAQTASEEFHPVGFERREAQRIALDGAGQMNCVAEAQARVATPSCPEEIEAFRPFPPSGIRILDAMPITGRGNPHHATNGEAPDAILPGWTQFVAWYGLWGNIDGDERVRALQARTASSNEWIAKHLTLLVAYVEPGSHPSTLTFDRPDAWSPDFFYDAAGRSGFYYRQPMTVGYSGVIFLDGSLARALEVATVAEPELRPSVDAAGHVRPYTPVPGSRVDIDRYPALAPPALAALYDALAGPLMDDIGSPSLGLCPAECRPSPSLFSGPAETVVGPLVSAAFARYEHEVEPGSGATASGRHAEYIDAYSDWMDLVLRQGWACPTCSTAPLSERSGDVVGRGPDGRMAPIPGTFSFEIWIGLWKDRDGDGFVGTASPGDAYESGTRAYPDRPYASAGEFVGAAIPQQASCVGRGTICRFLVTLVPDDDWRPGTFTWVGGVAREPAGPLYGEEARFVAGRAPIELVVIHDPTLPGRYATESVTFAAGAPAFTACTDAGVTLAWTDEIGSPREAPVRDCDRFEAWTPTTA